MTTVFSLPPIASNSFFPLRQVEASSSRHVLPSLPTIAPTYSLESVDEYEWQGDRVLPAVERGVEWARPETDRTRDVVYPSKGKGKQRAEVREVEEGIWVDKIVTAFQHINREALRLDGVDPIPLASSSSSGSVFPLLEVSHADDQPFRLADLPLNPEERSTSGEVLATLLLRKNVSRADAKAVKWDERRCAYRLSSRRVAQTGGEELERRTQGIKRIATALERLDRICGNANVLTADSARPTVIALRYATGIYLAHCKSQLARDDASGSSASTARSVDLNEVDDALRAICNIWNWPVDESAQKPGPLQPSNDILTDIYTALVAMTSSVETDKVTDKAVALAYLLQHASLPLFRTIAAWVGLQPETSATSAVSGSSTDTWSDLGITQRTKLVAGQLKFEYAFDASVLPAFIPPEARQRIFEGGKSLRLLREASPGHPAAEHWDVPFTWHWALSADGQGEGEQGNVNHEVEAHIERMQSKMDRWKESLQSRPPTPVARTGSGMFHRRRVRGAIPDHFRMDVANGVNQDSTPSTNDGGGIKEPARARDSDGQVMPSSGNQSISNLAAGGSLPRQRADWPDYMQKQVLALALAHATSVNTALVNLFFDELHYASHLDVLRAYWLGGDAAFSERVSAALFGVGREDEADERETGLGRRARTRARMGLAAAPAPLAALNPAIAERDGAEGGVDGSIQTAEWGIALGVGLNERDRWPPGGSEMAYALRTTLVDAEISSAISTTCTEEERFEVWEKVQDTVSFAIRPLPQDEVQKKAWKDPQSIEALDFLFLAYSPPPTLPIVLPRAVLDRYQVIHNHLLRFSRVQVVLRGMYRDITRRPSEFPPLPAELLRVAIDLRISMSHFVETSTRYILDIAIGANINRLRGQASVPRLSASAQSLVDDHHRVLDDIMQCCLLGEDELSESAYDVLMHLLSLVLDAGKAVRCAVRGWSTSETAMSTLVALRDAWDEAGARFPRTVQRIARQSRHARSGNGSTPLPGAELADEGYKSSKHDGAVEMALREWLLRLDLYFGTSRPDEAMVDE